MADETFTVKVYDPTGLKLQEQATAAQLQTVDGQVGILPRHTSYAVVLSTGPLTVSLTNGEKKTFTVVGGFASFEGKALTVLGDAVS